MSKSRDHWQGIYASKKPDQVSWFQESATRSLELIKSLKPTPDVPLIDIGGGASRLADGLIEAGFTDISVLDLAEGALNYSRERLGSRAENVTWIHSDVLRFEPRRDYWIWHDRAFLHFLTRPEDQRAYVALLNKALKKGGFAIFAPFAEDGPEKCSGLEVCRYDFARIDRLISPGFKLITQSKESHITPAGKEQRFNYFLFEKTA